MAEASARPRPLIERVTPPPPEGIAQRLITKYVHIDARMIVIEVTFSGMQCYTNKYLEIFKFWKANVLYHFSKTPDVLKIFSDQIDEMIFLHILRKTEPNYPKLASCRDFGERESESKGRFSRAKFWD